MSEKMMLRLDAVQQEINDLVKRKYELKNMARKRQRSGDEEDEFDEVVEKLAMLVERERLWLKKISKDDKPDVVSKSFSEAKEDWIASVTGVNCDTPIKWTSFTSELKEVAPSAEFQKAFENISKAFHMTTEAGRRIYLNLFLSDIILQAEFNNELRIFPELELSVQEVVGEVTRVLKGRTDYTIGFSKGKGIFTSDHPRELHLVAIEAKSSTMSIFDVRQCIAETSTLYKSRKVAGKANCAVWGVISNAEHWKFIHIDHEGKLYQSQGYLLELCSYDHDQVKKIYQLLYYVVNCCYKSCTPNPTPASSSVELNE
jgi:hypothetical protein